LLVRVEILEWPGTDSISKDAQDNEEDDRCDLGLSPDTSTLVTVHPQWSSLTQNNLR